jgi:hypothetical protein
MLVISVRIERRGPISVRKWNGFRGESLASLEPSRGSQFLDHSGQADGSQVTLVPEFCTRPEPRLPRPHRTRLFSLGDALPLDPMSELTESEKGPLLAAPNRVTGEDLQDV